MWKNAVFWWPRRLLSIVLNPKGKTDLTCGKALVIKGQRIM